QRRFGDVHRVQAQLDAVEAAERIRGFREQIPQHEAPDPGREHIEGVTGNARVLDARPVAATVEVQRILREAAGPIQAMRLVRVETEELRLADAAIDGAGQHDGMIAEDIRERDRSSPEDAAPEVVARVTDGGA